MVLYTPLSLDDIYPSEEEAVQVIEYQGRTMHVRQNVDGNFQLVQLISTNPADFLQDDFQPGAILQNEYIQFGK